MQAPTEAFRAQQEAATARFAERADARSANVVALERGGGLAEVNSPDRLARRLDRLSRYYAGERMPTTPEQVPTAAPTEVIDAALERVTTAPPEPAAQGTPATPTNAEKVAEMVGAALEAMAEEGEDEPAAAAAPADERAGVALEKIIGTADFLDIRYLEAGVAAARAVCRIDIRDARGREIGYGTGSLVSPRLLLTNHHVLADAEVARRSGAEFDFQDGVDGQPLQATMFGLDPEAFFVADRERDFALVAVAAGEDALARFGVNPLIEAEGKAVVGEFVTIVQHPGGRKKQISLRENRIVDWLEFFLHYQADTEPGSSGSPVFNDQWEIVALHHASVPDRQRTEFGGFLNEGVRASRILKFVHAQSLPSEQQALADALRLPEQIRLPAARAPAAVTTPLPASAPANVAKETVSQAAQEVRITVPLEVSVRLGTPTTAPAVAASTPAVPPDRATVAGGRGVAAEPPAGGTAGTRLRLLVEAPPDASEPKAAVKLAAERSLGPGPEGGRPLVAYLFEADAGTDPELGRFFEVVVGAPADGAAWDLAYALQRELPEGFTVEPDLPSSLGSPDPDQVSELEAAEAAGPHDWALTLVHAREAWALACDPGRSTRGAGISVGHPDTGYVLHEELEAAALDLARDKDVITGDDDATDPLERGRFPEFLQPGHGTRTGSVIAGRATGVLAGVAPEATLVPIRTVRSVVQVLDGDVAKAVDYARRAGCHVISMSLGGVGFSGLEQAINRAVREGLIVLAAAGNFVPFHLVCWPARYRNCLAVAAVNIGEKPWKHSSSGGKIVAAAPGESVWVPDLSHAAVPPVTTSSGTSFAVAHLAGAAACWLSFHGRERLLGLFGRENLQSAFVDTLRRSSRDVGTLPDGRFGAGILDLEALLRAELPSPSALPAFEEALEVPAVSGGDFYELFPDVPQATVDRRLAAALGVSEADAPDLVRRYGRELLHVVAEDRTLHEQLGRPDSPLESAQAAPLVSGRRLSLELAHAVGEARTPAA
ncbi:MAG TPA: S8 family serine peptidase [Gaiellaceae bacterium]|nr:S8 family serine peptidase [Gaiellaceae bacterium]